MFFKLDVILLMNEKFSFRVSRFPFAYVATDLSSLIDVDSVLQTLRMISALQVGFFGSFIYVRHSHLIVSVANEGDGMKQSVRWSIIGKHLFLKPDH